MFRCYRIHQFWKIITGGRLLDVCWKATLQIIYNILCQNWRGRSALLYSPQISLVNRSSLLSLRWVAILMSNKIPSSMKQWENVKPKIYQLMRKKIHKVCNLPHIILLEYSVIGKFSLTIAPAKFEWWYVSLTDFELPYQFYVAVSILILCIFSGTKYDICFDICNAVSENIRFHTPLVVLHFSHC